MDGCTKKSCKKWVVTCKEWHVGGGSGGLTRPGGGNGGKLPKRTPRHHRLPSVYRAFVDIMVCVETVESEPLVSRVSCVDIMVRVENRVPFA